MSKFLGQQSNQVSLTLGTRVFVRFEYLTLAV